MEMTITLEFLNDTLQDLRTLEHELKAVGEIKVFFIEPKDADAPVLISLSIHKKDDQADLRIRRITHVLYDFLHSSERESSDLQATLVTIEGQSIDISPLDFEDIRKIIANAYAGQAE